MRRTGCTGGSYGSELWARAELKIAGAIIAASVALAFALALQLSALVFQMLVANSAKSLLAKNKYRRSKSAECSENCKLPECIFRR